MTGRSCWTLMSQETLFILLEAYQSTSIVQKLRISQKKTKTMEEVLSLSQETLKKFLLSLSAADQHIVSLEAKTAFLKDPKAWEAEYRVLGQEEEDEEEDVNTVINAAETGAEEETPHEEEVT